MTSVSVSASSAHWVNRAEEVTCPSTLVGSVQKSMTVPTSGLLRFVFVSCRRQC